MVSRLPAVNAVLNFTSALLLMTGYLLIRRKKVFLHRVCMSTAFVVSAAFLVSYLTYHWHAGHVPYRGQGALRTVYFAILTSHTLLAIVIVPLVLRTLFLALK